MPVTPAFRRLRQENAWFKSSMINTTEFQVTLGRKVSSTLGDRKTHLNIKETIMSTMCSNSSLSPHLDTTQYYQENLEHGNFFLRKNPLHSHLIQILSWNFSQFRYNSVSLASKLIEKNQNKGKDRCCSKAPHTYK